MELFVRNKNTTKITISANQRISTMNCMNYGHNTNFGLFKFQSDYSKFFLKSPKVYSRKTMNAQTDTFVRNLFLLMLYLKRKPHIMLQLHIPEQIKFNSKPLILFVVLSVTSTIIIVSQRQMLSVNNGDRNEIL